MHIIIFASFHAYNSNKERDSIIGNSYKVTLENDILDDSDDGMSGLGGLGGLGGLDGDQTNPMNGNGGGNGNGGYLHSKDNLY